MNNICTTVEQSKRLLGLGLNPLTSDMYWGLKGSLIHPSDEYELNIGRDPAIEHNLFSYREGYTIPAWSLEALLELMPKDIILERSGYKYNHRLYLTYNYEAEKWTVLYSNKIWDDIVFFGKTSTDAAYNMVVWLLENNYIKKESNH